MFYHVRSVPRELENEFWNEGRMRLERLYPELKDAEQQIPKGFEVYQDIKALSPAEFREKYKKVAW